MTLHDWKPCPSIDWPTSIKSHEHVYCFNRHRPGMSPEWTVEGRVWESNEDQYWHALMVWRTAYAQDTIFDIAEQSFESMELAKAWCESEFSRGRPSKKSQQ